MENKFGSLQENYTKIKELLGIKFLIKSYQDQLSVDDFLFANNLLGDVCYGTEINRYLANKKMKSIEDIYYSYLESLNLNNYNNIDFNNIGLILVRPECFVNREEYKKFLEKKGLEVLYEKRIQLNFRQYLLLYYYSFILEDTIYDFPSRTFNYINNDSYLLIVKEKSKRNVADYLCSIKGRQGRFEPGTLRGDIAYNFLKSNVVDGKLIKNAIIPLDPIGTARMLTRNKVWHDGSHMASDIPILFYCGQAVHVPNGKEIKRDLITLCNEEELELVLRKSR